MQDGTGVDTLGLVVCVLKNTILVSQRLGHGSGVLVARLAAVAVASPPEKREAGTFGWRPGTCGPNLPSALGHEGK